MSGKNKPPLQIDIFPFTKGDNESWRVCRICGTFSATHPDTLQTITGGRMHPESQYMRDEGGWICLKHFRFMHKHEWDVEGELNIEEEYDER